MFAMEQPGKGYRMLNIKISYPFDSSLSKNRMHRFNRFGRKYLACRPQMEALTLAIAFQKAKNRVQYAPGRKVMIGLMVYLPNHRSDSQNYLDVILDAVQKAIGVNDRWFCGSWDWEIDKKNPRFVVNIQQ